VGRRMVGRCGDGEVSSPAADRAACLFGCRPLRRVPTRRRAVAVAPSPPHIAAADAPACVPLAPKLCHWVGRGTSP